MSKRTRTRRDRPARLRQQAQPTGDSQVPLQGGPHLHAASRPPIPSHRLLRGYAFDPRLATRVETALVSEITYKVPWEELKPGPIGEYLEVIDHDPASRCFYAPVHLDDRLILAQNGLPPSEGSPQFHQQMVYAAAMTTIDRFERALGRRAFWTDRFAKVPGPTGRLAGPDDEYVPRLRLYPHALRMANAYYSRDKGAILFGYFPATEDRSSGEFPGGTVFTCLSHDIVAHETVHALLDGFHEYFMEDTNPDVLAFHEAFADIVALFQHFSFPEVLAHQIGQTRGDLGSENLLVKLATQFGHARGTHGALRDAIGRYDTEQKKWTRLEPDPTELERTPQVHARGAILVAAVFDAFLSIYHNRSQDLLRLASGGTGRIGPGEIHPDLVNRLAGEASRSASHVLNMCIRALDYCPPVDLTFGEYLRALITADMDLMPEDQHRYRVAFIEAFRRRGIYPGEVRTLSEDSLRWARPGEDPRGEPGEVEALLRGLRFNDFVEKLRYLTDREQIWRTTRSMQQDIHDRIAMTFSKAALLERITGLALAEYEAPPGVSVRSDGVPRFWVKAFREARREREDGRALNQVFVTLLQNLLVEREGEEHRIRCGCTLVVDLSRNEISYVIAKRLGDKTRIDRIIDYTVRHDSQPLAATYFGATSELFARLHVAGA